jgi:hypothetical protein
MLFMGLVDLDQPYWLVGEHHFLHAQLNQVGGLWERAKKELAPVILEATGWGKRGGGVTGGCPTGSTHNASHHRRPDVILQLFA